MRTYQGISYTYQHDKACPIGPRWAEDGWPALPATLNLWIWRILALLPSNAFLFPSHFNLLRTLV
ncbi:hypothetical protein GQ54DRAFT_189138 [Martensiomyces pterosporus]|nr:hypothetical protein GQ54DRAFT_189138 [Martensiomyces pterosporus]